MKRLGGWWRLWIIIAVLSTAAGGLLASEYTDQVVTVERKQARDAGYEGPPGCLPGTMRLQETYTGKGDPYAEVGTPIDPDPPEGFILEKDASGMELRAFCTTFGGVAVGVLYGLSLAAAVALIGLLSRWVFLGFRT